MSLKPYKEKLNNKTFSIGMSKKLPDNSTNLAFASSPKIRKDNISIVNEFEGISKDILNSEYELFYSNEDYLLYNNGGAVFIPNQEIEITDEFSLKSLPNDIPRPLFYKAVLSQPIKSITSTKNVIANSIAYKYGYEERIIDELKKEAISNNKEDILPLINIIDIKDSNGTSVTKDFKVRLLLMESDKYQVIIYHNLNKNETYKATYTSYSGEIITEIISSTNLFAKANSVEEVHTAEPLDKIYAMKQDGIGYNVYAPADMYKITDNQRKPYEFRYRIYGNIKVKYDEYNKTNIKIGVVSYQRGDGLNDIEGIVSDFINQGIFPSYVSFVNPHPLPMYYDEPENYFDDPRYWKIDLSIPQQHINEYDLIIISGYGTHDMTVYNETLSNYLEQGGNIFIDNLSNINEDALRLSFGSTPIIEYDYPIDEGTNELIINTAAREFAEINSYVTRRKDLTSVQLSQIAYIENGIQTAPTINLTYGQQWTDIIKYSDGNKCVGYVTYKNRGRIYLSNTGLLKAFTVGTSNEVKDFLVNMMITIVENVWENTPWITDRVFHIDQLYANEINEIGYEYSMSITNTPIAKKIIGKEVRDVFAKYTNYKYYRQNAVYYIDAQEYGNKVGTTENTWNTLNKVYMPIQLTPNQELYAYAISPNQTSFNINNLKGYSGRDIRVSDDPIKFKFTITPYTFAWVNDNNNLRKVKIEGSGENTSVIPCEISRSKGLYNLEKPLTEMVPPLPDGIEWAKKRTRLGASEIYSDDLIDKKDIFFEIKVGYYESGEFIQGDQRVNLMIYDKSTGEYKYDGEGSNIISYNDLFDSGSDIVIQVSTNYYSVSANKRVIAIRQLFSGESSITIPSSLNTNENWHPRIKYLNFIKNSFTKEDYSRIARTLKFKYEKEYIQQTLTQYYGNNPEDDTIVSIASKLNNNQTLDDKDWEIISEAFDLIDHAVLYEYEIKEYHSQAWDPAEPIKKSTRETAKYINSNTIKVQYPNIYAVDKEVVREELERVSDLVFKSEHSSWLESEGVTIEVIDENEVGGYRVITPENFIIDFNKGLITFNEIIGDRIFATYTYSNIEIYKKLYSNSESNFEELVKLDAYHYDIPGVTRHSRILSNSGKRTPKIYAAYTYEELERNKELLDTKYTIDYERGFVILAGPETRRLFIDYDYEQVEKLSIKDYDEFNGIIEINEPIHFNDNVYVTYYYSDGTYEYKGYRDGSRFIYLDMNPTRGHVCTVPTVSNGTIEYKEIPTYDLLDKTVYFYMLPTRVVREETAYETSLQRLSSTEFKTTNTNLISSKVSVVRNKVEVPTTEYTVDAINGKIIFNDPQTDLINASYSYYKNIRENEVCLRHTFDREELMLLQLAHPEMIVLGSVKITNDYSKYDISMLDTRVRGGGLKEEVSIEKINATNELSRNFWDISDFDGPSYYGNGVLIIKLPNSVLIENGGLFTREEVEEIVNKHLAYGVLPIIKFK